MPHYPWVTIAFATAMIAASTAAFGADPRAGHLHRARLVVVFAGTANDAGLARQREELEQDAAGTADRDLVLIPVIGTDDEAKVIARRYGVEPGQFHVVLVGKDGTPYARSATPMLRESLFERVDAMPMRQAEMRRQDRSGQADQPPDGARQ